jgi:hypothetical protein
LHTKGYAALETKAAAERARLLIEQAEAVGEPPEDPLLLFSILYSFWVASYVAFDGDVMRELADQFLALAEKQRATGPLMIGHRLMGFSPIPVILWKAAHLIWPSCSMTLPNIACSHRDWPRRRGSHLVRSILGFVAVAIPMPPLRLRRAPKDARRLAAKLLYALFFASFTQPFGTTRRQSALLTTRPLADEKTSL